MSTLVIGTRPASATSDRDHAMRQREADRPHRWSRRRRPARSRCTSRPRAAAALLARAAAGGGGRAPSRAAPGGRRGRARARPARRTRSTSACARERVHREELAVGRLHERLGDLLLERRVERDRVQRALARRGRARRSCGRAPGGRTRRASPASRVRRALSPIASTIAPRSRIETPSRSSACSTRWISPSDSTSGTTSSTTAALTSLSWSSSWRVSWRVSSSDGVRADRLGEVGDDDRLGVDDRVAERLGLGAAALGDPDGGQAEGRLGGRDAGELAHGVARVHRQLVAGHDAAARDLGAAHAHDVLVRVERDVVADAHGRDDDAELGRDLAADRADARQQRAAGRAGRRAARGRSRSPARAGRARARRARRRAARGSSAGSAARAARLGGRARARRVLGCLAQRQPTAKKMPPMTRNGSFGRPGTRRERQITDAGDERRLALVEDLAGDRRCRGRPRRPSG